MDENTYLCQYLRYANKYGTKLGIWPFQTGWRRKFSQWTLYGLFVSFIFTQISRIVIFFGFYTVAEQVPFIGAAFVTFIKYLNFVLQATRFAQLLTNMTEDWDAEKTDEETSIMFTYAERAKLYSLLYKLNIFFACIMFCSLPFIPRVLDVIKPLNESRKYSYVYPAYYLSDDKTFYYCNLGHTLACTIVCALILVVSDNIMIHIVQHTCGQLIIAGHRYKHAIDAIVLSTTKSFDPPSVTMYKKFSASVQIHNRAIELTLFLTIMRLSFNETSDRNVNEIESIYAINIFLQVILAIVTLSITLVLITYNELSSDIYPICGFVLVQVFHLLYLTIQGQFVLNSHEEIYSKIYEALWYNADPKIQAFYVLALRRSLTSPGLTAGGLIELNLDSFAEVIKASISYYTVLKSS